MKLQHNRKDEKIEKERESKEDVKETVMQTTCKSPDEKQVSTVYEDSGQKLSNEELVHRSFVRDESVAKFINDICTLLIKEAKIALDFEYNSENYDDGLDFAAVLLDEARKYHSAYPWGYGSINRPMRKASESIRNWNARQDSDRQFT